MISIEQTGKSIEDATQNALQQLGVTEDQVDVEILEEGSKGLLGIIGGTPARVRVTVRRVETAETETSSRSKPRRRSRPRPKPKTEAAPVQEEVTPVEVEKEAPARPKPRPSRPRTERPAPEKPREEAAEGPAQAEKAPPTDEELRRAADVACQVLQRILDGINPGARVSVKDATSGQASLEIQGGDAATLIGRHGQTINALQYLTTVIMNKQSGLRMRVSVDAQGYRSRREDDLKAHALALAEEVRKHGQEAVLESLPAAERRLIHAALADDPDVMTYSEGDEPERHVIISPRK